MLVNIQRGKASGLVVHHHEGGGPCTKGIKATTMNREDGGGKEKMRR